MRFEVTRLDPCQRCKGSGAFHEPPKLARYTMDVIQCVVCQGSGELRTPVSLEDALRELGYVKQVSPPIPNLFYVSPRKD